MKLLFTYIKQNKWFLKINYILLIMVVFFLLPGSGSKFPDVDPDPAKWYGSGSETLLSLMPA